MAIRDPGFWERFSMPTHHDEDGAKEPVTLVQIASTSSTRSRPELGHSYVSSFSPSLSLFSLHHSSLPPSPADKVTPPLLSTNLIRKSFLEYQEHCHKRSKRRLLIGGLFLVATTTVVTIVMVWLGVNGWFGGGKHKADFP
ncbi:MAG: hypothetical protein Q9220_002757 [cf. Caloplaca sp. 1 TL-2023]